MGNSQQKSDKIDSNSIIRVNENASVRQCFIILHTGIFIQMRLILKG